MDLPASTTFTIVNDEMHRIKTGLKWYRFQTNLIEHKRVCSELLPLYALKVHVISKT